MVAQRFLVPLVGVRVPAGLPLNSSSLKKVRGTVTVTAQKDQMQEAVEGNQMGRVHFLPDHCCLRYCQTDQM
jgi:hypothetical protein